MVGEGGHFVWGLGGGEGSYGSIYRSRSDLSCPIHHSPPLKVKDEVHCFKDDLFFITQRYVLFEKTRSKISIDVYNFYTYLNNQSCR